MFLKNLKSSKNGFFSNNILFCVAQNFARTTAFIKSEARNFLQNECTAYLISKPKLIQLQKDSLNLSPLTSPPSHSWTTSNPYCHCNFFLYWKVINYKWFAIYFNELLINNQIFHFYSILVDYFSLWWTLAKKTQVLPKFNLGNPVWGSLTKNG